MWGLLDQADAARHAAADLRRHLHEVDATDLAAAQKMSERLDARAAELEYRWIALPSPPAGGRWAFWGRLIHRQR
jgi:hypothetical protein